MVIYSQGNKILNRYFGNTADSVATTLYIGLSSTPINADGTGTTEPTGGGYTRVAVTNNKTSFSVASNGELRNAIEITFPEATATWGNITHVFIAEGASSAPIYADALPTPRSVQAQSIMYFTTNSIQIKLV